MKTTRKNLFLVILSALFAIFLFGGIGVKVAFAETATLSSVELTMDKGASVRKNEPTGLRFTSVMSVSDYNALTSNVGEGKEYSSVSFGMLIAPQDYIAAYGELSEENVFGENAKYSFGDGESDKPKIINVYASTMKDYGGNKAFTGIITNIKPVNYNREFVGVGYIKATAQDGTVTYKFAKANDNARSVISVAQKAIAAGETDENGVLADFTKFADLGGIVSSVVNGDKTKTNAVNYQTGEISVTATADDFNIYLNKDVIAKNGENAEYVRLYLKSSNAAETWVILRANGGTENWEYCYCTLTSDGIVKGNTTVKYLDIPLNDTSVHDFSKYDLRLRAATAGQNITIEKIEYISLAKNLLKADSWDNYDGSTKTENVEQESITLRGWQFGISSAYIQKAIEAGYTHLRFDYKLENSGYILMQNGNSWQDYYKRYAAAIQTARIDLSSFKIAGESGYSYAKIWMQGQDINNDGTDYAAKTEATLTVSNPVLFKSTETAGWTKNNASVYCAVEENGFIVLDTVSCGAWGNVVSSAEWWAKYANNSATGSAGQRTMMLSGEYFNAGSNYRGAIWGGAGSAVSSVGTTANTEIVTEYLNDTTYAEGNKFYYGLESEGVYSLKVNEFVSNRNSSGGFAYTYIDETTFTVTLPKEGRVVNVNTQDYIAKGYTKLVITASEYIGGQIWVGNDNWNVAGGMNGLNSGASIELDLIMFTADNPYLHIYCSAETTTVTITYRFF